MQVSCSKCGASYQFDSSTIPAEGYHAQCTGCGEVFFVKPEAEPAAPTPQPRAVAEPTPAAPVQITVTCSNCGAVYQFAPADIPAAGYDAQCTQCQAVFFVSPTAGATPQPESVKPKEPEPVELLPKTEPEPVPLVAKKTAAAPTDIPQPTPIAPDPGMRPNSPSVAEPAPQKENVSAPEPFLAFGSNQEDEDADLLALDNELGEPDAAPNGASMEDDFEQIMKRKRKRLMSAGCVLIAIPLLLAFVYLVMPGVWDASIGPLVGVKARVNPDAIPLMETGLTLMLNDTDKDYSRAIENFEAALEVDDLYPEALAFAGLAYLFKGKDIHDRGLAIRDQAQTIVAEIMAINEAQKKPKNAQKRVAELRSKAQGLKSEASKLNEEGSAQFAKGWTHFTKALEHFQTNSPLVVGASGIFLLGRDKDRINDAKLRLEVSLGLYGAKDKLDIKNPPDPWLPYLEAMVRLATRNPQDDVEAIGFYQAALKKEPRFQRARYDLAQILYATGKNDKALVVAEKIVAEVPEHQKAREFIDRVKQNGGSPGAEAASAPGGKKKKKKKRR